MCFSVPIYIFKTREKKFYFRAQKTGSKYSTGTEDFMIEKFIFHPDFDTKFPYKNNIALLKLETNISRSNRSYYGYDSRKCDRADNVSSIVLK